MIYRNIQGNVYQEGTTISAKGNPDVKLIIMKYYQGIYYCAVVGKPELKQLAYFERELIPPVEQEQQQFTRVTKKMATDNCRKS